MENRLSLLAVPFGEYSSKDSSDGMKYDIVDSDGNVYVRCVVNTRRFADHDLVVKELAEAPSLVRVEVTQILDSILGADKWKVTTRVPSSSKDYIELHYSRKVHSECVEISHDLEENRIRKIKLQ